jgi:phospholipid/cholesterol/gamma-HCH transport system substrate-binding protein
VQITAGTASKPLLKDTVPSGVVPLMKSKRDALSDLLAGGGFIVQRTVEVLDRVNRVFSDENIKTLSATMSDVQATTAELRERKSIIADAQKTLQNADQAAQQIRDLAANSKTLVNTDGKRAITKVGDAATEIQAAAADVRTMINKLQGPTSDFATNGLPQLTSALATLETTTKHLDQLISEIQRDPRSFIGKPPAKTVEVKP